MKTLLKKKIVLIPLVSITLYLIVVIIYYFKFSSDASEFCDRKFRWRHPPGDRDITPEMIDSILFQGAAEKGYSVKTIQTGNSCPTCTDGVPSEIHIVTPDGYKEWISEAPIPVGTITERRDIINEVIKKYKDRRKECDKDMPSFFSTTIFSLGMLHYVSKRRGGGTYMFEPEFFWWTPAMFMSMLP
tara:strand:- start:1204 stop:1764 length:561 start_codon:yes stop_codon:yes gene_type:complete